MAITKKKSKDDNYVKIYRKGMQIGAVLWNSMVDTEKKIKN